MTVSSPTAANRWAYPGNGETTEFVYTSRVFDSADLKVYLNGILVPSDGVEVTGIGDPAGGHVKLGTAPEAGTTVVIVRDVPATQVLDLAALGSFPAEENERALDRLTVLVQQMIERHLRSLRQPETDEPGNIAALPVRAARAGHLLAFDANGDPTPGAVALPAELAASHYVRVKPDASTYELRTPEAARSDLGADDAANLVTGTLDMARIADGSIAAAKLSTGVVASHLGFMPLNRGGDTMTGGLNMQAAITLAADPASAMQAATKQYVDGVAAGLGKRGTVRAATTADHALADLGAIDGVTPVPGDLILVKNQAAPAANGVYAAAAGSWSRAPLFDSWDELTGSLIAVQEGAAQADTLWLCASNSGGTLGSDAVLWSQIFPGSGGTVTNIATANGVAGGPITSTGTIELDVNGLAEDTAPDLTADFVPSYDASAGVHRKLRLQNITGTQVSMQSGSFTVGTTPNVLHVITAAADATLPSAAAVPNGWTASFKNATDGRNVNVVRDGTDTIDGLAQIAVPGRETVEVTRTAAGTWTVSRRPALLRGAILAWGSNTLPAGGYVWANGAAISRSVYDGLFAEWGTTYGPGDGSTTFNVPDLRGRVLAGKDDMGGAASAGRLTTGGSGINGTVLGAAGGAQTHTLTIAEMPGHSHGIPTGDSDPGPSGSYPLSDQAQNTTFASGSAGSGAAHQNTQPTTIAAFVVKA